MPDQIFSGVGTVLFNMAVNPVNGHVYVSNTDAQNDHRFEGVGNFLKEYNGGQTVRGHLAESRITVLDGATVSPRHLNKHIDYSQCCAPIPNLENATSVAFPMDMAITRDGQRLYVAGFGSSEVAYYDTGELEQNTFTPDVRKQIAVSGGGASGLALDETHGRLYVMTRFDNAISTIDIRRKSEVQHVAMVNPEPERIVKGRRFLYDASYTSSHGDSACASCHIFGDFDSLAWDLGDPDGDETENTGPLHIDPDVGFFLLRGRPENPHFRPMKGPMTTQSLRGLANHGAMHWRGDRTGGNRAIIDEDAGPNLQPNGGSFNEDLAFRKFNVAFFGLNGRDSRLTPEEMQAFTDFALDITYPPNPNRNLDNSLTPLQRSGEKFFTKPEFVDTFQSCTGCHVLNPAGNSQYPEVRKPGFFGTDGQYSFEGDSQYFKVPHLRNLYQKVGMFGMASLPASVRGTPIAPLGSLLFIPIPGITENPPSAELPPQVRGFGFIHDGSVDTVFRFLSSTVFAQRPSNIPNLDPRTPPQFVPDPGNLGGLPFTPEGVVQRQALESYLLAFDSNLAPIVGQQVTVNSGNAGLDAVNARLDLLMARAEAGECDLVATRGASQVLIYRGDGRFQRPKRSDHLLQEADLRRSAAVPGRELTYTCTPPGSGFNWVRLENQKRDHDGRRVR